jgi:hypothetical protein
MLQIVSAKAGQGTEGPNPQIERLVTATEVAK